MDTTKIPRNPMVWLGFVGLVAMAAYELHVRNDPATAMTIATAALGLLGIGSQNHELSSQNRELNAQNVAILENQATVKDNLTVANLKVEKANAAVEEIKAAVVPNVLNG